MKKKMSLAETAADQIMDLIALRGLFALDEMSGKVDVRAELTRELEGLD